MDLALQRWKVSDRHNVEELYFGDELLTREEEAAPPTNEVMTIVGVSNENRDEDLSTLDLGSYTEEAPIMLTPEKKKKKSSDEDDTVPETPTKYGSLASKSISEESLRRHSARFRCFLGVAVVLGMILLGSIGILSLNLYTIRNEEPENSSSSAFDTEDTPQFDFSDVTGVPVTGAPISTAPVESPTSAPVVPVTNAPSRKATSSPAGRPTSSPTMLRATAAPSNAPITSRPTSSPTSSPTRKLTSNPTTKPTVATASPTGAPATQQPTGNLDILRQELIQVAPMSADALFDEASVQYSVLEWLVEDPFLSNYTTSRILQRFALGTMFWSLSWQESPTSTAAFQGGTRRDLLDPAIVLNWMTYGDECDWPLTRDSEFCDASGNVKAIFLENVGFSGTLASEISLLSNLQFFFVNWNEIQGTLPSEIGMLSNLVRLQVPQNNLVGTLPTEIGRLTNLRILGIGRNSFEGTLPTELGLLNNLGTFESRRNDLTGPLPSQLSNMTAIEYISVEYNNLSGEIPTNLASLESLSSLRLKENAFTGSVPKEVCKIKNIGVSADCDEIECDCCDDCCYGCTRDEEDEEPEPFAAAITQGTAAVTTLVPSHTLQPAAAETESSSSSCSSIHVPSVCYNPGQDIELLVESCDADAYDLIVMFEEGVDITSFPDAVFWVRSCGQESCNGVFGNGVMIMENKDPQRLGFAPWPLELGEYRLYLLRVIDTGVVETLAMSSPFRIDAICQ